MIRVLPSKAAWRAFTLLELLVVVAIIAILAGILVPALGSMKNAASTSKCASNLRQIFIGVQLYAGEHDGFLPGPIWSKQQATYGQAGSGSQDGYLATFIAPYLQLPPATGAAWSMNPPMVAQVFVCPAWQSWSKRSTPTYTDWMFYATQWETKLISGVTSTSPFGNPAAAAPGNAPLKLMEIASPARAFALSDYPGQQTHNGKLNYLFFDGHVETLKNAPTPDQ